MAAGLLVGHHGGPDLVGVEIVAAGIEQRLGIGLLQPRRKTFADQAALPVTAVGIEAVADHPLAVADGIGDDGDEARRHLGEVDIGVTDRRGDRLCDFADVDDADGHGVWLSGCAVIAESDIPTAVIPREGGVSSTLRPIDLNHCGLWNTGSPPARG
jgi:hypothetical protein